MNFDIRQSQVIHTWPTGAIIDFPQLSLIMLCHDDDRGDWGLPRDENNSTNNQNIINDPRLAEAFKVKSFIMPPIFDGINTSRIFGIRFPSAYYCPKCGLINVANKYKGEERGRGPGTFNTEMISFWCNECFDNQKVNGPALIPMRFVIATEDGFLDDFPWDWYVHKKVPEERGKGNRLFYNSKGGSASLSDIVIKSERADGTFVSQMDLSQIFDQKIFAEDCKVHGNYLQYTKGLLSKPWKGWGKDGQYFKEFVVVPTSAESWDGTEMTELAKGRFPRTMQRGAGNLIFPIIYSSILLPESSYDQPCPPLVHEKIRMFIANRLEDFQDEYSHFDSSQWRDFILTKLKSPQGNSLTRLDYSVSQMEQFVKNYFGEDTALRFGNRAGLLRSQEYQAFCTEFPAQEKTWFQKRNLPGADYNNELGMELFDSVVLLDKLSAIKVLRGFTRIKPLMTEELIFADEKDDLEEYQRAELQRIQDARKWPTETDQLPAVEVRGEGIFLKFNYELLEKWAENYPNERLAVVNRNLRQANLDFHQSNEPVNKRYLFLHTLSHILLKELAEDCGYSMSSLAEIIYCSDDNMRGGENEMNGILIYTTTSDSEGSLGGLVEKGSPKYLAAILNKGIDKARWCSSDPLCISASGGQGFLGLNLAACYSCVLLPETSCEKMNKYLDRATLVGTLEDSGVGLF